MSLKKIGLALGGGVVRGFAHVGVLMALEEAGIQVDVVTGTSVGSIVGAFVAAGYDARSTAEVATHISWRGMARVAWPGRGGWLSFYKLEQFVRAELRNARIEELKLPFAAVATDLATGNPVVLTEGPVARAVHASSAVPGVVCPVVIDGQFLSDGGVSDNLPVRTTRALGAEYVIACNILGRYWSRASNPVSRAVAAVENAIRWAGGGLLYADCLIEPDVADVAYQSFSKREYMVSQGRRATERKIPEILRAIQAGETPAPTQVQREIARGLEKAAEAA